LLRFFAGLAFVTALVAAFAFAWIALLALFGVVAIVAAIAGMLGRGKRPAGPVTIEGEARRLE
jgi:hypothetical protein